MAHRGRLWAVWATVAAAVTAMIIPVTVAQAAPAADQPGHTSRIVGGDPASTETYPWVVYLTTRAGFQFCGGTLAAPTKVVTAAHCATGSAPAQIRVVAGRTDKDAKDGTVARVTAVWVHPEYVDAGQGSDVSVLTLDRPLPYQALPLATPKDNELYRDGTEATILGWGTMVEGGSASDVLREAQVPVRSDAYCALADRAYDSEAMVCAGLDVGGKDTCQGDSGGPLVAGGKLIGITSWGNGCGEPGQPGFYTRVATYNAAISAQLTSTAPGGSSLLRLLTGGR